MKWFVIGLVALCVMLAPAAAGAQSSTCEAYNPQLCNSSSGTAGSSSTATGEVTSTGALPFTGLDTGALVFAGGLLVVAGFGVRAGLRRLN